MLLRSNDLDYEVCAPSALTETSSDVTVSVKAARRTTDILCTFPFSSDRKTMGTIVRAVTGPRYHCKGAAPQTLSGVFHTDGEYQARLRLSRGCVRRRLV